MEYNYTLTNDNYQIGLQEIEFSFKIINFKNRTKAFLNLGKSKELVELTETQIRKLASFVNEVVNNKRI